MDTNKMREQFEAWVLREYPNQNMGRFADGEYHSTTVQYCWLSWQGSREAVVVALPKLNQEMFQHDVIFGHEKAREEARSAIEAQGLKVQP